MSWILYPSFVEQDVSCWADYAFFIDGTNFVIVKLVPITLIQAESCVVSSLHESKMVADSKKIINWFFLARSYQKRWHVKSTNGKLHHSVWLRIIASKSFQVDNQNRWNIVYLDFLQCLFVRHTLITVPSVTLGKVFWLVKLSKAVLNTHMFGAVVLLILLVESRIFKLLKSV